MWDFCVIGGGFVGLSTAMRLLTAFPGSSLVVLEKETSLAAHQTGRNSGVIHSGIYYAPGSLKAKLCREGLDQTKTFCLANAVPFETCGKHLVATNTAELERMNSLAERALANGVAIERIDGAELARREPNVTGIGAIFVPDTAIVSYRAVCAAMASHIRAMGGEIELGVRIDAIQEDADAITLSGDCRAWRARQMVACAGLQADRIARLGGLKPDFRILPFRGEYFRLPAKHDDIVRSLIYPIPDPTLPFLGVHLTRMIDGGVTVGPNAVLAFSREGYGKLSVNPADVIDFATYPGFWRTTGANLASGAGELRDSLFKSGYLARVRRYAPGLTLADLTPEPAGVRAQVVLADGALAHDFIIKTTARSVHVCNAPSPAATSALPIGSMITEHVQRQWSTLKAA